MSALRLPSTFNYSTSVSGGTNQKQRANGAVPTFYAGVEQRSPKPRAAPEVLELPKVAG